MIICTGRFRQRFASAVGSRALNPGADTYFPLSYHEYRFHELILNSPRLDSIDTRIGKFGKSSKII